MARSPDRFYGEEGQVKDTVQCECGQWIGEHHDYWEIGELRFCYDCAHTLKVSDIAEKKIARNEEV